MVNYKINVYLKHTEMENMYVREFIELVTQDINGNNFEFTVYEDDNVYDLTNKRVTMVVKSDSGTVIQENCQVVDAKQGKATITLPPDMLIENGPYMAEVQIWEGVNSRVTTLPFDYTVRLSLENDESIKADPRFSLLQVALQNVNDADGKSKEALKLSKEAKAICDDLVPKANTAAQNAQTALDRAESVVTQEELAQKVMLDGKDTKFDFIKNSSIGIVDTVSKTDGQIKISDTFDYSDSFVFGFKYIANSYAINGANRFLFNLKNDNLIVSCIQLGDASGIIGGFSLDIRRNDNTIVFQGRALFKVEKNVPHQVLFALKDNVPSFFFDGELITFSGDGLYKVESNFPNGIFIGGNARPFDGKLIYNFYNYSIPAPQEIEHSFSVLNNSPSIKELRTTDSTGKTSILKLASDTDHVTDRSGRTQDEINRTFYKRSCKEIPSPNGEPIIVNNGEEGYVLSAEIKGNTIKNICKFSGVTESSDKITVYNTFVANNNNYSLKNFTDKPIFLQIYNASGDTWVRNASVGAGQVINITSDEMIKSISGTFASGWSVNDKTLLSNTCMIIPTSDINKITSYIPFGLSSTEAIISNTGEQYPIYANEEDKANKKVISLDGLEGARNKLELKEDGSAIFTQESKMYSSNYNTVTSTTNLGETTRFDFEAIGSKMNSLVLCDKVAKSEVNYESQEEHIYSGANKIWVFLKNTTLNGKTPTEWLKENTLHVIAPLDTPILTHIPKELVPAILTHKTNILEAGGAVKPSSFKVTVPVDKLAEIEARLQALESTTVDVVLNK